MLLDHCFTFGLLLLPSNSEEEISLKKGPLLTHHGPALDPPLGGSGPKVNTNVRAHDYFIPTKFCKYPSSDSVFKADYVFPYIIHYSPY